MGSSEKSKVNSLVMGERKGEHFAFVVRYLKCDQYIWYAGEQTYSGAVLNRIFPEKQDSGLEPRILESYSYKVANV